MNRLMEPDGTSDDVSDWGSDFDEDIEDNDNHRQISHQVQEPAYGGDLYEVPDGKPLKSSPTAVPIATTIVPDWLKKSSSTYNQPPPRLMDENIKPPSPYIEHVLLPTRASKDDDSKNFIETLKRKLSQKHQHLRSSYSNSNSNSNSSNGPNHHKPLIGRSSSSGSGSGTSSGSSSINGSIGGYADPKTTTTAAATISQQTRSSQDLTGAEHELVRKVKESLYKVPWFYRVDRNKAELILENCNSDGSFLVRECHHGGPKVPFTLTIRFRQRLFHIQIRIRPDVQFALGTSKLNEMHFATVQEMIDTYRKTPLQLHSNGEYFGETKLTHPPIVYSFSNSSK